MIVHLYVHIPTIIMVHTSDIPPKINFSIPSRNFFVFARDAALMLTYVLLVPVVVAAAGVADAGGVLDAMMSYIMHASISLHGTPTAALGTCCAIIM